MTDVATNTVDQQLVKKTHPVRGILWGLMMGLGLSIVLVLTKVIPLDPVPMLIVLVLGTVVGTLWSIFGPAKHAEGRPGGGDGVDRHEVEATMPPPVVDEPQPADTTDAASTRLPPQPTSTRPLNKATGARERSARESSSSAARSPLDCRPSCGSAVPDPACRHGADARSRASESDVHPGCPATGGHTSSALRRGQATSKRIIITGAVRRHRRRQLRRHRQAPAPAGRPPVLRSDPQGRQRRHETGPSEA